MFTLNIFALSFKEKRLLNKPENKSGNNTENNPENNHENKPGCMNMIVKIKYNFQMRPNKCELTEKKYKNGIEYGTKEEPKKNQQTPTHSIKSKREYEQRHKFFLTICKKVYSV